MTQRDDMDTHEIFQLIPRGRVSLLAAMLHLSPDMVRRWRREPLGEDAPTGTGAANPLDRLRIILAFAHAECPALAEAIEEWVHAINASYYRRLAEGGAFTGAQLVEQTKRTLREIGDVVEAIAIERRPEQLGKKVAEMIAEVRRLEAMLSLG